MIRSQALLLPGLLAGFVAGAQPSFCFVLAEGGPALGPLDRMADVVQHYRERVPYVGMNGSWLRPDTAITLQGGPLFRAKNERWQVYHPVEAQAESYVLAIVGADTMRIDLPEDPQALIARASQRWNRDTPEVIRFRNGRFPVEALIEAAEAQRVTDSLAAKLIAEDAAAYRRSLAALEEHYRTHPYQPPPVSADPPPRAPTLQEIEREIAQRPGLKSVDIDRVNADTVWVRISGCVMLNGGCASGMPLFGLEMLTDTGCVERIPFELIQMDCGMPWADWEDHLLTMPLAWWARSNSREGEQELRRGQYRLVFMGANMKFIRTEGFTLE